MWGVTTLRFTRPLSFIDIYIFDDPAGTREAGIICYNPDANSHSLTIASSERHYWDTARIEIIVVPEVAAHKAVSCWP